MTDVLIKRELLERLETWVTDDCEALRELQAILAAPRQPDGEGLEVVAWQDADNPLYTTAERRQMHGWATDGYPIVELCRLPDAQRAIAELRDRLDVMTQCADNYSRMFEESAEECEHLKACQENDMLHMTGLVAERDTLRQQIVERDAQIASMRAEVTPFIETHWVPVAHQRDKLADLLADVKADYTNAIYWEDMHAVMKRIDAVLAEIEG